MRLHLQELLPTDLYKAIIAKIPEEDLITEMRFRVGKPVFVYMEGREYQTYIAENRKNLTQEDIKNLYYHICKHSVYAYEEERRKGYMTIQGGHRLGITGQFLVEKGEVKGIHNVAGIYIRIAHEKKGISKKLLYWCYHEGEILNTMIISPPGLGKTTLLRELIRNFSNGTVYGNGRNITVVDERSEIGGCYGGVAQNDLGLRTDCMDGMPKREGVWMALRTMRPDVIAVDEVGDEQEEKVLQEALHCGVKLILTMHGENMEDVQQRIQGKELLLDKSIARFIEISETMGRRKYLVRDSEGKYLEEITE